MLSFFKYLWIFNVYFFLESLRIPCLNYAMLKTEFDWLIKASKSIWYSRAKKVYLKCDSWNNRVRRVFLYSSLIRQLLSY